MSYATPQQFINRVDSRRLGDLGLDNGNRDTPTGLLTNTRLQDSLDDASGIIDADLLKGGRYLPSDLTTLSSTTSYGNSLLIRICVSLAYGLLLEARGFSEAETSNMAPGYTGALSFLELLAMGQWVFGTPPVVLAGRTSTVPLSQNITMLTSAACRYFGDLNYQFPIQNQNPPID